MIKNKESILNTIIEKNLTIQLVENAIEHDYTSNEDIEYVAEEITVNRDYLSVDSMSLEGSTSQSFNLKDALQLVRADNYIYNLYKSLMILRNIDLMSLMYDCVKAGSSLITIETFEGSQKAIVTMRSI